MSAFDGEFNRSLQHILRPNLSSGAFIGGSQGSHDWLTLWVRSMTGQLVGTPCDSLMEAAEKELIAFERNECEFRKREKQERADELEMPALREFHN